MKNILLLDTSVGSFNKGDEIIMECVNSELEKLFAQDFTFTLPTHVCSFHWYQVWRNSSAYRVYANCDYKFAGGSNLLVKNMLTHFPQWNVNLFNYQPLRGTILCGVGAGAGSKTNGYTRRLYQKMLNNDLFHSVRDSRSKEYVESLGLKVINTGCVTMWALTPEFCKDIPTKKADNVVFTLTATAHKDAKDQVLIDTLVRNYDKVYFWIQGHQDLDYIKSFDNTDNIELVSPSKQAYHTVLMQDNLDYVGTRLHAGVYAMRHKKRAIIIAIDERASEINKSNNLNCLSKDDIGGLEQMINSEFETRIKMPVEQIELWKSQFKK